MSEEEEEGLHIPDARQRRSYEEEEEIPGGRQRRGSGGEGLTAITAPGVAKLVNAAADLAGTFNNREKAYDFGYTQVNNRLMAAYDRIAALHEHIAEKDRELSKLYKDDHAIQDAKIKAEIENARTEARVRIAKEFFETIKVWGEQFGPSIAARYRPGDETELTYAEAMWTTMSAFLTGIQQDPELVGRLKELVPQEFLRVLDVFKKYKAYKENGA